MNFFSYPASSKTPPWLRAFNTRAKAGKFGTSGAYALAFDVWRGNEHLFRSYDLEDSETLDAWCRRNFPTIEHPDYRGTAWGLVHLVSGIDSYPIPTRAALHTPLKHTDAETILKAALATAQWPHGPTNMALAPTGNAIRQRLHHAPENFKVWKLYDHENGVAIRAVVGYWVENKAHKRRAVWEVATEDRKNDLAPGTWELQRIQIEAPDVDLLDAESRRPLVKLAKKELGLTGFHSVLRDADVGEMSHNLTAWPYKFIVKRLRLIETDSQTEVGGFDFGAAP